MRVPIGMENHPGHKDPVYGVILAAGRASRFGSAKLLQLIGDDLLIHRVVRTALSSRLDHVAIVLGHEAAEFRAVLDVFSGRKDFSIALNPDYAEGMAGSLVTGLRHVMHRCQSVMFLLGDMPGITTEIIDRLIERFRKTDRGICIPFHKGRNGHPTLFGKSFFPEILRLQGDIGAREIVAAHPESVLRVPIRDPAVLLDIDTRRDLESFLLRNR